MQRRKFLKIAGGTSALSTLPIANAKKPGDEERFKQIVETASKLRAKAGKDVMNKWLDNQPVDTGFNSFTLPISLSEKSENIGTEKIEDGAIIIDMGLYDSWYTPTVAATIEFSYDLELDARWSAIGTCWTHKISYGEYPKDAAAMTWNTDQWEAISTDRFEATDAWGYVETYAPFETGAIGADTGKAGFRINDYQASADWIDIDELDVFCETASSRVSAGTAALYLERAGDYEPSERVVKGGYDHAYDAGSANVGASLSIPPSASVTLMGANENIKERPVIRDRNGDEIEVKGDEVETGP